MARDIRIWLEELDLDRYIETFVANDVDLDVLRDLDDSDLAELGVSLGHRKKLLRAIEHLKVEPAGESKHPQNFGELDKSPAGAAERRQLTLMFVDLVGSTALAARLDPEEMFDVIRAYQNAVTREVLRFDGQVAKFMGDGVLAYFGWPGAHEDDAERAVRAGLEIAKAVANLGMPTGEFLNARMGIATGPVVVGDLIGSGSAQEETVVGETPNLAARLQDLADVGTVVVADATRKLLGDLFIVSDLGTRDLKGFSSPKRAWGIVGEGQAEGRFEALHGNRLSRLVGRENELTLLLDRWRRATTAEGQVVLLSGEPGIGKSRITFELRERLGDDERIYLRYHGSPYHTNTSLFAVTDELQRAAGFTRLDAAEVRLAKLEALLGSIVPEPKATIPLIAEHLAIATGGYYPPIDLTPGQKKSRTFDALLARLEELQAEQPVLVTVEDAHWLDPTSLELFDLVVDRIARLKVLLVVTSRPEFAPRWNSRPHVTLLTLNRLERSEGAALIAQIAGSRGLPVDVETHILEKTEGVPLFVEELTRTVLESELLHDAGERDTVLRPQSSFAIPSTLQDSLMSRLDRLGPAKQVAQIGAVIGRDFDFDMIAATAEMEPAKLTIALDQIVRSGHLIRRGLPTSAVYRFRHALVQDAAYQSLLKSRRQKIHRRIATVLERGLAGPRDIQAEVLARHYTEANLVEPAIRNWLRAAEMASHRSADLETIAHCEKGLALVQQLPAAAERDRHELELRVILGSATMTAKGFGTPDIYDIYSRARELCGTVGKTKHLFPVVYGLWVNRTFTGRLEQARELAAEALDIAQAESLDDGLLLQGHHMAWTAYYYSADLSLSLCHAEAGIGLYDLDTHRHQAFVYGGHDPGVCCRATAAESLWFLGYAERALSHATDAVTLGLRLSHPFSEAQAQICLGRVHRNRREVDSARRAADAVIRLCEDHVFSPFYSTVARALRGWALVQAGETHEGIKQIGRVVDERPTLLVESLVLLADACLSAGRIKEGLDAVAQALVRIEEGSERIWEPELHWLNGQLFLTNPAYDEGKAKLSFERALEVAREMSAKSLELRAATSLARLLAKAGERGQAYDQLRETYGWFTEGFDTPILTEARALLDRLS